MDITSANASIVLSVPLLLPVPTQIQGFAADNIYSGSEVEAAELRMGIDGILSGGVIKAPIPQEFELQADSPSITFFDAWYYGQKTSVQIYACQGVTTLTSIGTSYACTQGFLKSYKPFSDAKKVLEPRRFTIWWQSILPVPVGSAG